MEKFKRDLKHSIGNDLDNIELIDGNLLVIPDKDAAERIERCVFRIGKINYAYYDSRKGGVVFTLKH